jgi:phage-related protein
MERNIIFYKDYFYDFYDKQTERVKRKIDFVLDLVRNVDRIPEKFFKHMEGSDGLFEIRVKVGSDIFRIFSFFDEGSLVVAINGFQKKTDKTPKNELERAERIKQEYFKEKEEDNDK